jgi:hypothetical protein
VSEITLDVGDDDVVRDLLLEAYRAELKKQSRSGRSGPVGPERRYSSDYANIRNGA